MTIDERMTDLIWHPKISFLHLLSIKNIGGLGFNNKQGFYAENNHTFTMEEVIEVTISCDFNFQDFPFDNHECDFEYWVKEESIIKLNTTREVVDCRNSGIFLKIFFENQRLFQ